MKLSFECIEALPRLAWCAKISRHQEKIKIWHGPWVETRATFFCEGAWSGEFESGDFDECVLMGSGGKLSGNHFRVTCPHHTLEPISLARFRDAIFVSNSTAFLLAILDDSPNPNSILWGTKLASIVNGLKNYPRKLPTRRNNTIALFHSCNIDINCCLQICSERKMKSQEFQSFSEYESYLEETIRLLGVNVNDPLRKVGYRPVTTISSGYDSPVAAVMSRSIGCKEALTLHTARGGAIDSGEEIARILGMRVHVEDRDSLPKADLNDSTFGVPDLVFAFEKYLEGAMLFTGHHGDAVWSLDEVKVSDDLVRSDPSGCFLEEFRMRVGWIHVPVPFIGSLSHPSIFRISQSSEMDPWKTPGKYSRPIPRRIVEEAGVSRRLFGVEKRAAAVVIEEEGGLSSWMTSTAFKEFQEFSEARWGWRMAVEARAARVARWLYRKERGLKRRIEGLLEGIFGLEINIPMIMPREMRLSRFGYLDRWALLCPWAYTRLLTRYAASRELRR